MMGESTSARRRHGRLLALWLAAAAAAVLMAGSTAQGALEIEGLHEGLADFDVRTDYAAPTAGQLEAAAGLGARVTWNRFGTPASVFNPEGNLASDLAAPNAAAAARAWLGRNAGLFRLPSADGLALVRDTPLVGSDGHAILLGQRFDGLIATPDGLVTVAVTGSAADGWDVTYASSSLAATDEVTGEYVLTPAQAWLAAAEAVDVDTDAADVGSLADAGGWTRIAVDGFARTQSVRRVAFPMPGADARAAYQAVVTDGKSLGYVQTVDATTGKILARSDQVDEAVDNPRWEIFPANPPLSTLNAHPWSRPSVDTRITACWAPAPGCEWIVASSTNQAGVSLPWDMTDPAGPPTNTTRGNDANSREQWISAAGGPTPRPAGTLFQPTSATRDYVFPWTNQWFESRCDPAVLGTVTAPNVGANDISAATVNLFAMHSLMHDWSYRLGFTESAWNAQQNNFATPPPFLGNDPVTGNAQAAAITGGFPTFAGRDNATMNTQADGTSSVTNMFLWQPIAGTFYAPCVDGDYDMSVIGHEYGHMIENRMIGKGFRRQGDHAGAMGESFGDMNGGQYLNSMHLVPVDGENPWAVGPYATGNPTTAIRNSNMSFPSDGPFPTPGVDPEVNTLNLGSTGYDITGPQVHADGEMWSVSNWTVRKQLLKRYPAAGAQLDRDCAEGRVPVTQCPGDRRWFQLYYDAMLLMPVAPSFVAARDAILAADMTRFGGANQDLIWRGFALRGFGQFATAASPTDGDPIPDFSSSHESNATVIFQATEGRNGSPVLARVYVGAYEARATQIADTIPTNDPTTAPTNLDATALFVPTDDHRGRKQDPGYQFVATAPGHGAIRFRLDSLRPGETRTVRIEFPVNLASVASGATAVGDGNANDPIPGLFDDTENTTWTAGTTADTTHVNTRRIVITLPRREEIKFVQASALLRPGQNRYQALRRFELLGCDAGRNPGNPTCDAANPNGWRTILVTEADAFPGTNPRPTAPDMILRTWEARRVNATHVIFHVLDNQCTGQPSFQGEQDNDPQYSTDCRVSTPPLVRRDTVVTAAELQLLDGRGNVRGADGDSFTGF
jgi:hypothetical protein